MAPQSDATITVNIKSATNLTGISRSEIYRLLAAKKICAVKSGSSTLIRMDSLKAYISALPEAVFRAPAA